MLVKTQDGPVMLEHTHVYIHYIQIHKKIRNEKTFSIEARKITCKNKFTLYMLHNSLLSVLRTHPKVVERHKRLI